MCCIALWTIKLHVLLPLVTGHCRTRARTNAHTLHPKCRTPLRACQFETLTWGVRFGKPSEGTGMQGDRICHG